MVYLYKHTFGLYKTYLDCVKRNNQADLIFDLAFEA